MLDLQKHISIFNPHDFDEPIAIIGVGAVGSVVALELAKLGLEKLIIYDFDKVEAHNIPNQLIYGVDDIGKMKVHALSDIIHQLLRLSVPVSTIEVGETKIFPKVAFLCVDTMKARKNIFEKSILNNGVTEFIVDARINANTISTYAVNTQDIKQIEEYRRSLYSDEEVLSNNVDVCSVVPSVGATAHMASSIAIWLFIQWANKKLNWNEVSVLTDDWSMLTHKYESTI